VFTLPRVTIRISRVFAASIRCLSVSVIIALIASLMVLLELLVISKNGHPQTAANVDTSAVGTRFSELRSSPQPSKIFG